MSAFLTPTQLETLRRCSRDDQAFEELRQLVETVANTPNKPDIHREILELQEDCICRIDAHFHFTYVNESYARLCQLPASALLGKLFWSVVPAQDITRMRQIFDAVMTTGQPNIDDQFVQLSDKATVWIEWTNTPLFDTHGQVTGILAVGRDITARKLAEAALKENDALLRQIVEHSQEVFYLYDPHQQQILYINPAYETIWGRPAHELYIDPQPFLAALHLEKGTHNLAQTAEETQKPYAIVRPDGQVRHLRARQYPVMDEAGNLLQIVGIAEDVTEKVAADQRLHDLQQERERMHLLYNFIHDVTHEFRTPLTIIYTSLHLLMKTPEETKQQVYQERIVAQINMLTRLVDDLNMMARLDSGLLVSQGIINVQTMIRQLVETYQLRFPEREFQLKVLEESFPDLLGSETDLVVALNHLLENAMRFSQPQAPISVTLGYEAPNICIGIQDTGVGIIPKDLPHIFKRFYRSDTARTTRGFGLGLPIVKRIVELHQGTIQVRSELDSGSTFIIYIPILSGTHRAGFPALSLPLTPW
jgi:PAS domain S-box-containing protein